MWGMKVSGRLMCKTTVFAPAPQREKMVRSREQRIRRDNGNMEGKFRVIHNSQYRVSRAYELSNYSIRKLAPSLFGFVLGFVFVFFGGFCLFVYLFGLVF